MHPSLSMCRAKLGGGPLLSSWNHSVSRRVALVLFFTSRDSNVQTQLRIAALPCRGVGWILKVFSQVFKTTAIIVYLYSKTCHRHNVLHFKTFPTPSVSPLSPGAHVTFISRVPRMCSTKTSLSEPCTPLDSQQETQQWPRH